MNPLPTAANEVRTRGGAGLVFVGREFNPSSYDESLPSHPIWSGHTSLSYQPNIFFQKPCGCGGGACHECSSSPTARVQLTTVSKPSGDQVKRRNNPGFWSWTMICRFSSKSKTTARVCGSGTVLTKSTVARNRESGLNAIGSPNSWSPVSNGAPRISMRPNSGLPMRSSPKSCMTTSYCPLGDFMPACAVWRPLQPWVGWSLKNQG